MTAKQFKTILADVPDNYDVLVRDALGQEWENGEIVVDSTHWLVFIQSPIDYRKRAFVSKLTP